MQRLVVWSMLLAFIALGGCDRARSKFDRIGLGMTRAEAVKILGEPQEKDTRDLRSSETGEMLHWRLGDKTLVLQITKDRVTRQTVGGC
jgi:hypothetical protein